VHYKYVVDGTWRTSPADETVRDPENRTLNNSKLVAPTTTVHWKGDWEGDEVFLAGSFGGWREILQLRRPDRHNPDWHVSLALPPGDQWLQFLVDGQWMTSPGLPVGPNERAHVCNRLTVDSTPTYTVYYATGWQHATLVYRIPGHVDEWQCVELSACQSRSQPANGRWMYAQVPVPATVNVDDAPPMEFYMRSSHGLSSSRSGGSSDEEEEERRRRNDGELKEDRPNRGQGAYLLHGPGGYKLLRGRLTPFPRACSAPIMVVSDLDGTMVGEGGKADAAMASFCDYWENSAALVGSRLVYNTGRSIGQFVGLLREKGGNLALPDVIITAVGTKIFHRSDRALRQEVSEAEWVEDKTYAKLLDKGWDLQVVRDEADRVRTGQAPEHDRHNMEGQCNWLDNGSEHPHRIALSMHVDCVERFIAGLEATLPQRGVEFQTIVSGEGDWRYVDVVAINGGKLAALEYVREIYGVPRHRTMACGDSKNDILMLEGKQKSVAVGNSQPELVQWLMSKPQSDDSIIFADGEFAYGILEGLCRHGLY